MKASVTSNEFEKELVNILQFWSDHMVDTDHGGFYGRMTGDNILIPESQKGVILNARILWTFSAAYKRTRKPEYRTIADRAFQYLLVSFVDEEYGGVYWMLDHKGKPIDTKKQVYAQAFAIYGLAEYYKVSLSETALQLAKELFMLIETYAFDSRLNGYIEAKDRKWYDLEDVRLSDKDLNATKTMNTHLHILEAYTNLLSVWEDIHLKEQLRNLIELMTGQFLSKKYHFHLFFDSQWNLLSPHVSYGHDIEGSWLLCEAAQELGDKQLSNDILDIAVKMVDAALEGMDRDGGLMNEGDESKVIDTDKHWWPQAEALVGLLNAWSITNDCKYLVKVMTTWEFINKHLIDLGQGEWHWKVSKSGENDFEEDKAGPWKCPYHNGRAMLEIMNRMDT